MGNFSREMGLRIPTKKKDVRNPRLKMPQKAGRVSERGHDSKAPENYVVDYSRSFGTASSNKKMEVSWLGHS